MAGAVAFFIVMVLAFETPNIGYIAYIDESGDPGLNTVSPIDPGGSSEWLVLGAVVTAYDRESEPIEWVRKIREACNIRQRPDLHFRTMNRAQKLIACQKLATLPVRCFALCSNKKNMKGYNNPRAAQRTSTQEWFYNSCVKYLLERVTEFVLNRSYQDHNCPKHLQLIFSERGGLRYAQTQAYHDLIKNQARSGESFHWKREIKHEVMNPNLISCVPHLGSAGVQLADLVASAFYAAAHARDAGRHYTAPAEALKPVMWKRNTPEHVYADNGVTLMPHPSKARLSAEQEQIFRYYGYQF